MQLLDGRRLAADDVGKHRVLLGTELAGTLKKGPDDSITLYDETFRVVGVFRSFSYLERAMVIMPRSDLQKVLGRTPHDVSGILVKLKPPFASDAQAIGILRAIGWRPRRVMRMVLLEALLLSVGGGVVGAVVGIALVRLATLVPLLAGYIEGHVAPTTVAAGFLIALTAGLVGAAYPAFRGARLLPTEAIRHE